MPSTTLLDKLKELEENLKVGKRLLADAFNGIGVAASPNDTLPDTFETFQSYADKIKRLMPGNAMIFEITIPETAVTSMDRAIVIPIYGLNIPEIHDKINALDDTGTTTASTVSLKAETISSSSTNAIEIYTPHYDEWGNIIALESDTTSDEDMIFEEPQFMEEDYGISLLVSDDSNYDYTVDWGDGNSNSFTTKGDESCYHVYTSPGIYQVKIQGIFKRIYTNPNTNQINTTFREKITKVLAWGNTELTDLSNAFNGCRNLSSIPLLDTTNSFENVTNFNSCFYNCSGLQEIPYDSNSGTGLFDGCANVTNYGACFLGCTGFKGEIPPGIFKNSPKVTSFYYVFGGCTNLTGGLPVGMFDYAPEVRDVSYAFYNCNKLTGTIDPNLLANSPNIINAALMFSYCTGLTGEVPEGLFGNCPNITDFRNCFKNCRNITSINPNALKNASANDINFRGMFENCTSLTEIPEGLFDNITGTGNTMERMFARCSGLTTIPATIFQNMHDTNGHYEAMFGNCTGLTCSVPNAPTTTEDASMWEDTSLVKLWYGVFGNCPSMTGLDTLAEECGGTKPRLSTYIPGDIVLADGTIIPSISFNDSSYTAENPVIGVVYDYDSGRAEGNRCLFMALADGALSNPGGNTMQWTTPQSAAVDIPDLPNDTSAQKEEYYGVGTVSSNGKTYTDTVKNFSGFTAENYPAINYCINYATTGKGAGEWYLPDVGDLWAMFIREPLITATFNNKLKNVNGTKYTLRYDTAYWSSREYSSLGSWLLYSNTTNLATTDKWNSYWVRPVSAY